MNQSSGDKGWGFQRSHRKRNVENSIQNGGDFYDSNYPESVKKVDTSYLWKQW
jgi:hypothetical protein